MTEEGREIVRNYLYGESNIPPAYLKSKIELIPEKVDVPAFIRLKNIHDDCSRFVKQHWNLNLYSSDVGNGKTSWAIKIMKNFIDSYACNWGNYDCLFINVPEFMMMGKNFSDPTAQQQFNSLKNRAMTASLVIFDEIASKRSSEFDEQLLYTLINYRINNQKSTIYTSNVLPDELRNMLGERIADRISGAPNTANIELKGGSRRNTTF